MRTQEEKQNLHLPKPSSLKTAPHHNNFPFCFAKTTSIQEAKIADRCKHCLVAFPLPRQKEHGPKNIALVHWEIQSAETRSSAGPARRKSTIASSEERKFSSPGRPGFDELKPTAIHPWYQCLVTRYPYFSIDLLEIDPELRRELDSKHKQLMMEQLRIDPLDSLTDMKHNWKENPEQ